MNYLLNMLINNAQAVTCNIAKKGFRGMRSSSPASISLYFDSDVLRIPFQAILPPLTHFIEQTLSTVLTTSKPILHT